MTHALAALTVSALTGTELLTVDGHPLPITLTSFWSWACSDLANNTMRGVLAEFIVGSALGVIQPGQIRTEWDAFDLVSPTGLKVEVKSSAYLQSWAQTKLSSPVFSIRPSLGWTAATNTYDTIRRRQADVYVFALLHHQDKSTLNPLSLDQWTFYVLAASKLNEHNAYAIAKSIRLPSLVALRATKVPYDELAEAVEDTGQQQASMGAI